MYGKYEKDQVGGKKHLKPRSEWKIHYKHHEAIIDREIFEAVRETRNGGYFYKKDKGVR